MAEKEFYLGDQGPYYYDTESEAGLSDSQLVTREELLATINLDEGQRDILSALLLLITNGFVVYKNGAFVTREILGTAGEIEVSNGTGYNADVQIGLPGEITLNRLNTSELNLTKTVYSSTSATTHKVPVLINGSIYFMLLSNV